MSDTNVGLTVLSGVFSLVTGTQCWKAIGLRGELRSKHADTVLLARTGLEEIALARLRMIQKIANDTLGAPSAAFDPVKARADPSLLSGHIALYQRAISARDSLPRWATRMYWWAGLLPYGTISLTIALVGLVLFWSGIAPWALRLAFLFGLGLLIVLAVGVAYFYLDRRMTSAYILSQADA